ncbi:MAG: DUF2817 domain-containing protein [Bacteriovoracaceae bacterium]|nr:DUF2817 domain-containing protein [Bacteriovoracaceae bacterium]
MKTKSKKKTVFGIIFIFVMMIFLGTCALQVGKKEKVSEKFEDEKISKVASVQTPIPEPGPTYSHHRKVVEYCAKIDRKFHFWGWKPSNCLNHEWIHVRYSNLGDPLMWTVFGQEYEYRKIKKNCTMIFCGVHGDEITTHKFCFDLINSLDDMPESYFYNKFVVVVPIVNPDGFFRRRPTRTNHRGVDINRNFPTKDWNKSALRLWRGRYRKDKRRFPGNKAMSEPETLFHVNIIKRYRPDKIISLHAPLNLLDYDGPMDMMGKSIVGNMANNLLIRMSVKSKNYRITDYPFFPGSLGNWAGNERKIPTYTLELPTTDPKKSKVHWELFKDAIFIAIERYFNGY